MTGGILFLAHRVPYPPDRGDRIRSYHFLRALASAAPVHLGCLADDEDAAVAIRALDRHLASHMVSVRSTPLWQAGASALRHGEPVSVAAWRNEALRAWVAETIATRTISTIFVFSGQMGQYVPLDFAGRVIVDLCDVDSLKLEAYARDAAWWQAPLYRREARLLRGEEARLVARADRTLLVSEAEAVLLRRRLPGPDHGASIEALGNGVDCDHFDPAAVEPLAGDHPRIVFTGQMDYPPNVEAVRRMAGRIMPQVRRKVSGAEFLIVGRNPVASVQALEGLNGTRVVGEVADMRPYLAAADLVVAPLAIARGVQNKVLEGMAMARPVLLSAEAATGIDAADGRDWRIACDDAQFIEHAVTLLQDKGEASRMGQAARELVHDHYGWAAVGQRLCAIVEGERQAESLHAA